MLIVNNLGMRYGSRVLFKKVSLQFSPGCRYGLVGSNGCGKTTFLKILLGEIQAEEGDVVAANGGVIKALRQDHFTFDNELIIDTVLMGDCILWNALKDKETLVLQEELLEKEHARLAELEEIISRRNGYSARSLAAKLLEGLGIQNEFHDNPLHTLSGGYKLRVLLAQVLFGNPEILLLDEPTNHLDIFSIKWLEGYLLNFEGILIVSSHDRDFLNKVCSHITDVDYGTMKTYKGNYEHFKTIKTQEREQAEFRLLNQEKRKDQIQEFVDRFKAKASKARQAQSKMRQIEKLENEMEANDLCKSSRMHPHLNFSICRPSGVVPLTIEHLFKSFENKKILHDVNIELARGDKIAIIGPNGIGKSTLLKILMGSIPTDSGFFKWGYETHPAYFPQDPFCELQKDQTILEWIASVDIDSSQQKLREILGRVLFSGDDVEKSTTMLSGGEASRLILARMMLLKQNFLIFDEPTNHLDMESIDELTQALINYQGTLIFVSHNIYFVTAIANRVLEITQDGIKDFRGSYPEYVKVRELDYLSPSASLKQRFNKQFEAKGEPSIPSSVVEPLKASLSYEERKQMRNRKSQLKASIEKLELECGALEQKIACIDKELASDGFYTNTSAEKQQSILLEKLNLEKKLQNAFDQWEALGLNMQELEEALEK